MLGRTVQAIRTKAAHERIELQSSGRIWTK